MDKFEEWIKTWIKGISNSPARSRKDHKVATMKMDILYSCLLKYRELKEKEENLKMTEDISWIYKRINELDKEITEAYKEKSRLNRLLREKTTLDGYFSTEQVDTYYR